MHRGPHPGGADYGRAFALGVLLNVGFVVAEAVSGWLAGSLALLADAGHNLSDVLGLLLAGAAHRLGKLPATERYTYGWGSTSILAALANAMLLLVAIGGIVWEAISRFQDPTEVEGMVVIVVAAIGVVINTATALLFVKGRKHDLNVQGAFLHMAADAAVSLGVVFAGGLVLWTGATWIDPATSLIIAAVIFLGTWGLLRESTNLALQAVPREIDFRAVREYLASRPGVENVHDLHIWAMSTTEVALTAHLVRPEAEDNDPLLTEINDRLEHRFGIDHVTVQIERGACGASCTPVETSEP